MHVDFNVSDAVINGAGWGALGALAGLIASIGPFLPIVLIMAAAGKAHFSKGRFVIAALIYGVGGAFIGAVVAHFGGTWWTSALVTLVLSFIPTLISWLMDARRGR